VDGIQLFLTTADRLLTPHNGGAMSSTKPGTGFGTFLEYMQSRGIGFGVAADQPADGPSDDVQTKVLASLTLGVPKDVATLLDETGGPPLNLLLRTLDVLQQFGLVAREENAGEVKFRLTATGVRAVGAALAGVTRP
jgi:hypothetical protein